MRTVAKRRPALHWPSLGTGRLVYHSFPPEARVKGDLRVQGTDPFDRRRWHHPVDWRFQAADVAAGKAAAQAKCVQCHEADDWEGESAASLEAIIRDIVAGKVKHKNKLELSPSEDREHRRVLGHGRQEVARTLSVLPAGQLPS